MKILRTHTCLKSVLWLNYFLLFYSYFILCSVCMHVNMCLCFLCIRVCAKKQVYHLIALSLRQIHSLNLQLLFYWLVWKTMGPCDPAIFASFGAKMIGICRNTLFFSWPMGSELKFLAFQAKHFCPQNNLSSFHTDFKWCINVNDKPAGTQITK